MKKTAAKLSIILMAILWVISGCDRGSLPKENPSDRNGTATDGPISTIRSGIAEQGISSLQNGFESTDTGVYFMCSMGDGSFLLYGDHNSDTLIKLCGRPDCMHTGKGCNAFFEGGSNICYYNGKLYATEGSNQSTKLVRMDIDGTNRETIYDTAEIQEAYSGILSPQIWNGIFTIICHKLDESGNEISQTYYYRLDGSMEQMEPVDIGLPHGNDGEDFIFHGGGNNSQYSFISWDSETGQCIRLFEGEYLGYVGVDSAYYIRDGIICEYSYQEGEKELFDTQIDGSLKLHCFPDCLVVSDYVSTEQRLQGVRLEKQVLRFYTWEFAYLGSSELDYPWPSNLSGFICGETEDRIILTDNIFYIPRYYIEKSDFGKENIEIHEFNHPDLEKELAELDALFLDTPN